MYSVIFVNFPYSHCDSGTQMQRMWSTLSSVYRILQQLLRLLPIILHSCEECWRTVKTTRCCIVLMFIFFMVLMPVMGRIHLSQSKCVIQFLLYLVYCNLTKYLLLSSPIATSTYRPVPKQGTSPLQIQMIFGSWYTKAQQ